MSAGAAVPLAKASWPRRAVAWLLGRAIVGFATLLTGLRAVWPAAALRPGRTLYFANHSSHADFVLLWAALPPELRATTRPVAGEDYWMKTALRRFVGHDVFRALMIRRTSEGRGTGAVEMMIATLERGDSLIMFPEGTRNTGDDPLLPLKSGLHHLAQRCPEVRLVPAWIENLKRVLPKGVLVPIPLACTVRFGEPLVPVAGEDKALFLQRAREALLDLRPEYDRESREA